ncbi:hypothetical protein ACG83_10515 [Frankia sp. R43]|uniref:hypothetical protein n=1 Tax=Frankia sp. R43 TaxID=269536 RepID=UPI0006CA0131|nr:hypothetical protein [Frankia sp. R43]KPM55707.1 hypothetical protein ACG83_10515 [Frankia sp. R43]
MAISATTIRERLLAGLVDDNALVYDDGHEVQLMRDFAGADVTAVDLDSPEHPTAGRFRVTVEKLED